jgi:hypothetical protein
MPTKLIHLFFPLFTETAYKNPHCHSERSEESPPFLSFQKTLKNEILHFVQDDKKDQ